eukprot:TRINITY_DN13519_c0_g1_i9.p1 TRINITY_DN13519_c0_g1~~TRINITY_DN13519_c0_g1_i9.p1  ORF type:complete len:576 (-),score=216.42 TRINITY_DN13519_c0_g1_i9:173-1900(-)
MPKIQKKKAGASKAEKGKKRNVPEESESEEEVKPAKALSKKVENKLKVKATAKVADAEPEKKTRGRPKSADKKAVKDEEKKDEKKEEKKEAEKKIVVGIKKGRAMVDTKVTNASAYRVYDDATQTYAASLMWSDLKQNNNKFYLIQLLESEANKGSFAVWNRWGRVGYDGQYAMHNCASLDQAKAVYTKKYNEKTSKGYTEIEISYEDEKPQKSVGSGKYNEDEKQVASKLDHDVEDLVKLIFNMKLMQKQMVEIGYDARKMPLGKLSKDTIKRGYEVLKQISDVLDKKTKGDLTDLSSKFFTVIPHDFGFNKMSQFVIDTKEKLKEKLDMVQSLGDIEIASRLLEEGGTQGMNEIDANYKKLKCEIITLDSNSEDFKIIEKYIQTTHAATHNNYSLDIQKIFKVNRSGEDQRYKSHIGNDMLLWHGSRLTNFVGILSQGLRIAPPEAPVTGYMFGKGVYFADMVSKSANYCAAGSSDNIGLMLLCRVAVGTPRDLYNADYNAGNLPAFAHSTKGVGRTGPGVSTRVRFRNMIVPIGPGVTTTSVISSLLYNEFIIYDVTQARLEYLVKLKFNYR